MDIILRTMESSRQVTVCETDNVGSLKQIFTKNTGVSLPKHISCQDKFGAVLSPDATLQQAGIKSGDVVFISNSREYRTLTERDETGARICLRSIFKGNAIVCSGDNRLNRISILSLLLALFVIGVLGLSLGYKFSRVHPFDYAMVFDAGSTHTELAVFNWQADKYRGTGIVKEIHTCRIQGGIGEVLRDNPSGASVYIDGCLQEGMSMIPEDRRSRSPVFLAATAGMRLLSIEEPETAQQIMGNMSRVLQSTGLLFDDTSVRIISGKEEAVSGWISANYLLHFLLPVRRKTVGVLDLGGASTQITFVKTEDTPPSVNDARLKLYGEHYDTIALSYLCLGQSEMHRRYIVTLLEEQVQGDQPVTKANIVSACHNNGFSNTMTYRDLKSPCTTTTYLPLLSNATVEVRGQFDRAACQKAIRDLMDPEKCRNMFRSDHCFYKPPKHHPDMHFVATSGLFYTYSDLGLNSSSSSFNDYETAGKVHCEKAWGQVVNSSDSDFQADLKRRFCFNINYNFLLLTDGYGFNNESWSKLAFTNKINGSSIGWQLGFAIRTTNYIPEEGKIDNFPTEIFAGLLFVFALFIGACATLLVVRILMRMRLRNNDVKPCEKTEIQA